MASTAPSLISFSPSAILPIDALFVLTFDMPVKAGVGVIEIMAEDGASMGEAVSANARVVFADKTVTIDFPKDLAYGHVYVLRIPQDAVRALDGTAWRGETVFNIHAALAPVAQQLTGTEGNDFLYGSNFNDALDGGGATDKLFGFDGNDSLAGGSGNDWLIGGAGNDLLSGGADPDVIEGGTGDDVLDGGEGYDSLSDNAGTNILRGGAGDDSLYGGTGSDRLEGGAGADLIDGGPGLDTAWFAGARKDYAIKRGSDTQISVAELGGNAATDQLIGVERLRFADAALAYDTSADGLAGQVYRLYQAAFDRTPDGAGLGYWIAMGDQGSSLAAISRSFVASAEYAVLYASAASSDALVERFYINVLDRAPDPAGKQYWVDMLNSHTLAVPDVLAYISESPENIGALEGVIGAGFEYQPWG